MHKPTVRVYLLLSALRIFGISFVMPIYTLYLLSKGLSLSQANLVNAVFWLTNLILEVPAGAFADVYGRKKCFIASGLCMATANIGYTYSHGLGSFAAMESLAALSSVLLNGAFLAWLTGRLKSHGFEGSVTPVVRQTYVVTAIAGIPGALLGTYLFTVNSSFPWLMSGGLMLTMTVLGIIFIKEDHLRQRCSLAERMAAMTSKLRQGWQYARSHRVIQMLLLLALVQTICIQAPNMQWSPYFKGLIGSEGGLGYVWMGMMLALAIGGQLGQRFENKTKRHNERDGLILALLVTGGALALATVTSIVPLTMALFFGHELTRGLFKPLSDGYLNQQIATEGERATILSIGSMPIHIGSIVGLLASGALVSATSITTTWKISGCLLVAAALLLSWVYPRQRST